MKNLLKTLAIAFTLATTTACTEDKKILDVEHSDPWVASSPAIAEIFECHSLLWIAASNGQYARKGALKYQREGWLKMLTNMQISESYILETAKQIENNMHKLGLTASLSETAIKQYFEHKGCTENTYGI